MMTSAMGFLSTAELLIKNHAYVNKQNKVSHVLVSFFYTKHHLTFVLCREPSHPQHGMTPMMHASCGGHDHMVRLLCRHGGLVDLQTRVSKLMIELYFGYVDDMLYLNRTVDSLYSTDTLHLYLL